MDALFRESMYAAAVKRTSALVKGVPSCQRTPGRRWYVTVLPSLDIPPF